MFAQKQDQRKQGFSLEKSLKNCVTVYSIQLYSDYEVYIDV